MTTTIQQLEAENAALKAQLAKYEACMNHSERLVLRLRAELAAAYETAETTARRQLARIEELMGQLAAAQKDAERWLFIREKSDSIAHGCWLVRDAYGLPVKDLQAAIDAAIAQEVK